MLLTKPPLLAAPMMLSGECFLVNLCHIHTYIHMCIIDQKTMTEDGKEIQDTPFWMTLEVIKQAYAHVCSRMRMLTYVDADVY